MRRIKLKRKKPLKDGQKPGWNYQRALLFELAELLPTEAQYNHAKPLILAGAISNVQQLKEVLREQVG